MAANAQQVQAYIDQRVRPHCERIRALYIALKDDKVALDDIYEAVANADFVFTDNRPDAPPHMATKFDVLAYNAIMTTIINAIEGDVNYSVVPRLCVRSIEV